MVDHRGRYEIGFLPRRIRLPVSKTKSARENSPRKPRRVNDDRLPSRYPVTVNCGRLTWYDVYYVLCLIRRFDGGELLLYVFRWRCVRVRKIERDENIKGKRSIFRNYSFSSTIVKLRTDDNRLLDNNEIQQQQQYVSYVWIKYIWYLCTCVI